MGWLNTKKITWMYDWLLFSKKICHPTTISSTRLNGLWKPARNFLYFQPKSFEGFQNWNQLDCCGKWKTISKIWTDNETHILQWIQMTIWKNKGKNKGGERRGRKNSLWEVIQQNLAHAQKVRRIQFGCSLYYQVNIDNDIRYNYKTN